MTKAKAFATDGAHDKPLVAQALACERPARFFGALPKACWYVFLAYIVVCIVLDVAVAPFVDYRTQWALSSFSFAFLAGGIVLGMLCLVVARHVQLPSPRAPFLQAHGFGLFVGIGTAILFAIQVIFVQSIYFRSSMVDWNYMQLFDDPLTLSSYYSINANNRFLGGFFAFVHGVCGALGIQDSYSVTIIIGCACISVSICLAAFVARRIGGVKCGVCAFLLMFVFVGLSWNLFIPYSDSYGMLFTTLLLFLAVCIKHPVRWPIMAGVAYLGYCVKPTIFAVFVAAAFVSACSWLRQRFAARTVGADQAQPDACIRLAQPGERTRSDRSGRMNVGAERSFPRTPQAEPAPRASRTNACATFAITVVACVAAVGIAFGVANVVKGQLNVPIYDNERIVSAHFLMLGANERYDGTFNPDDMEHSYNYHDPAEMTAADLAVWQGRLRRLGPGGIAQLLVRKNLVLYNDGTFFHWRESPLAFGSLPEGTDTIQAFYSITDGSDPDAEEGIPIPPPWAYVAQVLWFMTLVGVALGFLRKRPESGEMIAALSLLLLSGFLLIFEANARYLYLFSPFFVLLAVRGWQALASRIRRRARQEV